MIAMTVMFIGAAGVMTMQKTSVQGNLDARKADVASSIGRAWVERIRHESMRWTQPSAASSVSNLAGVPGIAKHLDAGWFRPNDDMLAGQSPPGPVETMSYAFDILGRDLAAADIAANAEFCVEAQISTLSPNALYRVDVRVVWIRGIGTVPSGQTSNVLAGYNWPCSPATVTFPASLDYTIFQAINMSTAIAESAAQ